MTIPVLKRNAVLLLAILLEVGPVVERRGHASAALLELMQLNGSDYKNTSSVIHAIKTLGVENFRMEKRGKRTYRIELLNVPADLEDYVTELLPTLIWEAPEPETGVELIPAPAQEPMVEYKVIAPPTADEVAAAILTKVMEAYNAEPAAVDADPALRQKLREAWDQLEALRRRNADLSDTVAKLTRTNSDLLTRKRQIEAELAQCNVNLRNAMKATNAVVQGEVQKGLNDVLRQAPGTGKGAD